MCEEKSETFLWFVIRIWELNMLRSMFNFKYEYEGVWVLRPITLPQSDVMEIIGDMEQMPIK